MEGQMKKMLAIAAIVAGLGIASPLALAQGYIVNGRAASLAEVQSLASHGAPPGHWFVDGYGMSLEQGAKQSAAPAANKCWYVLDVLLCD
jgi:hypothetical protein